ncbi:MAG: polyprenyl diphosphate synthase [Minisyncoccia bacterium]
MTESAPRAIGILIDGNRRWAKDRGLPSHEGHRAGFQKLREALVWVSESGISEVTIYAFSTENWNRAPEEVSYLMALFQSLFDTEFNEMVQKGFKIRFIGQRNRLSQKLQDSIAKIEKESKNAKGLLVQIAISYGARVEILEAVNKLLASGASSVDEAGFREVMWSAGMTDPDIIIRTGGDQRLSNFLLFQSAYSELFFTKTKWPDFSREEFNSILEEFANRERRHGR